MKLIEILLDKIGILTETINPLILPFSTGIATGLLLLFLFSFCPGEPDPSFFHDDEIENKKKEKNTQKKQEKEKEEQNQPQNQNVKKRRDPFALIKGIGIFIAIYTLLILICQQYGITLSEMIERVFPREIGLLKRIIHFHL